MKPIISPSILSADFGYLARDIEMINRSEAEWVHIDKWMEYLFLIFHSASRC